MRYFIVCLRFLGFPFPCFVLMAIASELREGAAVDEGVKRYRHVGR